MTVNTEAAVRIIWKKRQTWNQPIIDTLQVSAKILRGRKSPGSSSVLQKVRNATAFGSSWWPKPIDSGRPGERSTIWLGRSGRRSDRPVLFFRHCSNIRILLKRRRCRRQHIETTVGFHLRRSGKDIVKNDYTEDLGMIIQLTCWTWNNAVHKIIAPNPKMKYLTSAMYSFSRSTILFEWICYIPFILIISPRLTSIHEYERRLPSWAVAWKLAECCPMNKLSRWFLYLSH